MHTFVLILHVLGAGVLIGLVTFSVFLTVSPGWSEEKLAHLRYIIKFGKWAAFWQLVTGFYLASSEWEKFSHSKLFWIKMVLFVLQSLIAAALVDKKIKLAGASNKQKALTISVLTLAAIIIAIVSIGVIFVES